MTRELRKTIESATLKLIKDYNLKRNFDIFEFANKLNIEIIKVPCDSLKESHGFVIHNNKCILYCWDWEYHNKCNFLDYNQKQKKEYHERMQRWLIAEALCDLLWFIEINEDEIDIGKTRKFLYNNQELHYGNIDYPPGYIEMVTQQFAASLLMPEMEYRILLDVMSEENNEYGYVIEGICNEFGVAGMQAVRRGHSLGILQNECVPPITYVKVKR